MAQMGRPGGSGRLGKKDEPEQARKYKWAFPAAAAAIAVLWGVLNLPGTEDTQGEPDEVMPYATKRAGWPLSFARWSSTPDGQSVYSSFSASNLLLDLLILAVPIAVAFVVVRVLRPPEDKAETKGKGPRGMPPRRPPGGR